MGIGWVAWRQMGALMMAHKIAVEMGEVCFI